MMLLAKHNRAASSGALFALLSGLVVTWLFLSTDRSVPDRTGQAASKSVQSERLASSEVDGANIAERNESFGEELRPSRVIAESQPGSLSPGVLTDLLKPRDRPEWQSVEASICDGILVGAGERERYSKSFQNWPEALTLEYVEGRYEKQVADYELNAIRELATQHNAVIDDLSNGFVDLMNQAISYRWNSRQYQYGSGELEPISMEPDEKNVLVTSYTSQGWCAYLAVPKSDHPELVDLLDEIGHAVQRRDQAVLEFVETL